MKICAIICEYNPFHNGHKYLIEKAKNLSGADSVLCIMSGNFTERGEIAILNKFKRAKHAVLGGADVVLELPTIFATAPAEIFAKGAVKLLTSIPEVEYLAFGTENGDVDSFTKLAEILNNETIEFKQTLKENLSEGLPFAKAKTDTIQKLYPQLDSSILSAPNGILGVEYTRAILSLNSKIKILPIKRIGANFSDDNLYENLSSASAIRKNLGLNDFEKIKLNLPYFVLKDLNNFDEKKFKDAVYLSALTASKNELKKICDCAEGLENRIKSLTEKCNNYDDLVIKTSTKRYITTRIKRILLNNFLKIDKKLIERCLKNKLYLKVLAVKKDKADKILKSLSKSKLTVLTRKTDVNNLSKTALSCYEKDVLANRIYNNFFNERENENLILFV